VNVECQIFEDVRKQKTELKKKRSLLQMDELKCRKRVLRRLGYATAADVIELKGRVACGISRYSMSLWQVLVNFYLAKCMLACRMINCTWQSVIIHQSHVVIGIGRINPSRFPDRVVRGDKIMVCSVTAKTVGRGASSDGFRKQAEMMRTWRGAAGRSRCGQRRREKLGRR